MYIQTYVLPWYYVHTYLFYLGKYLHTNFCFTLVLCTYILLFYLGYYVHTNCCFTWGFMYIQTSVLPGVLCTYIILNLKLRVICSINEIDVIQVENIFMYTFFNFLNICIFFFFLKLLIVLCEL